MIFYEGAKARSYTLEKDQELYLVPFGEIQSEAEYPRLGGLVNWLVDKRNRGHKVGMFGMGDYNESPSPSDRAALNAAKRGFGMYEELARDIERTYIAKTERIAEILGPLGADGLGTPADILGLLRGHHWLHFVTEENRDLGDSNKLLAAKLGTEFWGDTVLITLQINGLPFKILATHGYGSSRTIGARIAKRVRMRDVELTSHWYVMGHDNEKVVYPTEALIGREYLKQYFTGSGSFQRAYNFDKLDGTYAEKLMLPPSALGVVMCVIRVQESDRGPRLDYHVST